MRQRIAILIFAILVVAGIIVRRYGQLRIEFDNTRFFTNAGIALSLATRDELNPQSTSIPDSFREFKGNILPRLCVLYPTTRKKSLIDPYFPIGLTDRYIEMRFGYVEHSNWMPPETAWRGRPVWFVWSSGPAQIAPVMVEEASEDRIRIFRFNSPPYQPSNGLGSEGYLYSDSVGNRVGKIR